MASDEEVLDRAIRVIEGEGHWCKGTFYRDEDGKALKDGHSITRVSACMEGALAVASQDQEQIARVRRAVLKAIHANFGERHPDHGYIPGFNDAQDTTQEDAILAFKLGKDFLIEK